MTYYIDVYGCQMNVHDSEIISGILESAGFSAAGSPETADVILLVSCAVREHAETSITAGRPVEGKEIGETPDGSVRLRCPGAWR